MTMTEREIVKTYVTSQTQWVRLPTHWMPVLMERKGVVIVKRLPWDWAGFFDKEEVKWGEWRSVEIEERFA